MVRLKTIREWRSVVNNPPRCCVNCDHYTDAYWSTDEICKRYNANPPQEYAESENECPEWVQMIPF
jgi:hypothetical protein